MKKDIYIIKNSINEKVYIGQAKNTAERWLSHLQNAKYEQKYNKKQQLIHRAINKYGEQFFHYEILEHQVENYDEREKYWINKYNSVSPNGYNISTGGNGTVAGIDNPLSIFKTQEELHECICEISSTKKTFTNIAKKYGCSIEVIMSINTGKRYKQDSIIYPLRDTNYRYSNEKIKQIVYSLKYELDLSMSQISKKYGIDKGQLSNINTGKIYIIKGQAYPIRQKRITDLSKETINLIINDIELSDMCMTDIAKKYNISKSRLSGINNGTYYKIDNKTYPIRPENDKRNNVKKKFLDIEDVKGIISLLKSNNSVRDISNRYNVSKTTIMGINNGRCKKYKIDGEQYPIRKLKKYN